MRGGSMGKRDLKKVNIFDNTEVHRQWVLPVAGECGLDCGWEPLRIRVWIAARPTHPKAVVRVKLMCPWKDWSEQGVMSSVRYDCCRSLRTSHTRFLVGVKAILPWSWKLERSTFTPNPLLMLAAVFRFLISNPKSASPHMMTSENWVEEGQRDPESSRIVKPDMSVIMKSS